MMLHNFTKSLPSRLIAAALALLVPACGLIPGLSVPTGGNLSLPGGLGGSLDKAALGANLSPGQLQAAGSTTNLLRSGNLSAVTSVSGNLGVPAALVLGRLAAKAIQGAVARRAEERQRQLEANQLFFAGQCKLDGPPEAATAGQDAAGLEAQADQAFAKGDYPKAEGLLKRAVEKRQAEKGGEAALARVLNRQAALYLAMSQLDKVEAPALRSLELREKAGKDSPEVAETLGTLGALYQQQSDFAKAESTLKRALKVREQALKDDHICVAQTVNQLGGLYKDMGAYSKAQPLYARALDIREKKLGPDSLEVAQSQSDLGGLDLAMGNYAAAEPYYVKALEIRTKKQGADSLDVADSQNDLGNLYRRRGAYPQAEASYRLALSIREAKLPAGDPRIADSLGDLAALYQAIGDLKAAEPLLRRALSLRQTARGKDSPEVAESLSQLAQLEQARGNLSDAENLLKEAIGIRELKLGREHPLVAESCVVLGDLYFAKADLNRADAYYQRALGIRQKVLGPDNVLVADCQQRQATVARARGNFAQAEPLYQQALTIREKQLGPDHPEVADTLLGLAAVQVGKGQTDAALPGLKRALLINENLLQSLSGSGSETRIDAFLRSLRAEEDLTYSLLAEKSPSDAVVALATTTALLRKGRSIDEAADNSRALYQGLSPEDQQKLASLRETRTRRADLALSGSGIYPPDIYQKLLKDLAESEEKQQQALVKGSATLNQRLSGQESPKVLDEVTKILPTDAGLFEVLAYRQWNFHPTEKQPQVGAGPLRYAALVVPPDGKPQAFDLGPGEAIDQAVAELLTALTNPESDWQPAAKKLSELVVKPAGAAVADRARLYVAPDGQLNLVPFAVLSDDKGLLVDHHELSYLTSGRDFLRRPSPANQPPHNSVALLADPEFALPVKDAAEAPAQSRGLIRGLRLGKVAPLPGTREEVKAIEKLLKKVEVKALYGADATKRALLAVEQPGILHVATHGLFLGDSGKGGDNARGMTLEEDAPAKPAEPSRPAAASATAAATAPSTAYSDNPLLSSMLVLAGAESASRVLPEKRDPSTGNGLVTALEVASMNLWGTQLVVLSACETGRGDVSSLGQGVYGLRRAVMVAGAETLLTSLWKVDDKATRDLMTKYYQNLLKGQGRGQGMRDAALALRKKKPHPYYWAPFITIGRSAPLTGIGKGKKPAAAAAPAAADDGEDT